MTTTTQERSRYTHIIRWQQGGPVIKRITGLDFDTVNAKYDAWKESVMYTDEYGRRRTPEFFASFSNERA